MLSMQEISDRFEIQDLMVRYCTAVDAHDWDAYVIVGGEEQYVGSREYSWDAEALCDTYVHEQLMRRPPLDAAPDADTLNTLPVNDCARTFTAPMV